jgi:hypothetical protein
MVVENTKKARKLKLLSKMFTDFSNYSTSQQGKDFSPFDNKVKVKINKKNRTSVEFAKE